MRQRSFPLLFLPVYDVQNLRSGEGPIIKTAHRLQCLHGVSRGIKMQERSQTEKDLHGQSVIRLDWPYFALFRYVVSLGNDRANWNRSQFARMPDGLRENGRRQTVYFFHPEVVK